MNKREYCKKYVYDKQNNTYTCTYVSKLFLDTFE